MSKILSHILTQTRSDVLSRVDCSHQASSQGVPSWLGGLRVSPLKVSFQIQAVLDFCTLDALQLTCVQFSLWSHPPSPPPPSQHHVQTSPSNLGLGSSGAPTRQQWRAVPPAAVRRWEAGQQGQLFGGVVNTNGRNCHSSYS